MAIFGSGLAPAADQSSSPLARYWVPGGPKYRSPGPDIGSLAVPNIAVQTTFRTWAPIPEPDLQDLTRIWARTSGFGAGRQNRTFF